MPRTYDFAGWATKNDLLCSDGRTIRRGAFKDNDGQIVPLVWNHQHNEPENVLGHALLKNKADGVYAYCTFNDTESGQTAKTLVQHGDVKSLSIYANQLKQRGGDVLHGLIREVSLVLAGANPGASIETVAVAHGDGTYDEEAIIYADEDIYLYHADDYEEDDDMSEERSYDEIIDSMDDDQREVLADLVDQALEAGANAAYEDEDYDEEYDEEYDDEDYDEEYDDSEEYEEDPYDEGEYEDEEYDPDEDYDDYEEDDDMKHNVFENDYYEDDNVLSHADMQNIFADAQRIGSLRDAVDAYLGGATLAHSIDTTGMETAVGTQTYAFNDTSMLFPDYKSLNTPPAWISRDMGWVQKVMSGVHHTPFTRIKSVYANITEDEARAKGYIKGNQKKNEVFTTLKRTTDPQTIYKKQKIDRDDIIDITDFDVVAWIKSEMRVMLNEEIARAILIGDGRLSSSDDKIQEAHIRPIVTDVPLFNITYTVDEYSPKKFIDDCVRARKKYKGSGNPTLFTTEDLLTEMLLLEDGIGHKLYKSEQELATALRVSGIVTVEPMEGYKVGTGANAKDLLGVIVNLNDYNVGTDKGGEINMFDDFDIDFNQYAYLMETRMSGALVKPFSAITMVKGTVGENKVSTKIDAYTTEITG